MLNNNVMTKIVLIFLIMSFASATRAENTSALDLEKQFDQLISTYWHAPVVINGINTTVFDYAAMAADAEKPGSLFDDIQSSLANFDPNTLQEQDAVKAFWINAYNFGAFKLVTENYPVDSIRSFKISLLKHPWSKTVLNIGGRSYSLTEIEKEILLKKFDDVRILFAVSCAAVSCPDRQAEAFSAARLNEQLDESLRLFFTNPKKGMSLNKKDSILMLSWILEKDRETIEKSAGDLLTFILPYLHDDTAQWLRDNPITINFFDHDWTLNDLAQAD